MKKEEKRLFFALDTTAPWPTELPPGRVLDEGDRHLTLAFLGSVNLAKLQGLLKNFPVPSMKVGLAGKFDKCLFLPKRHPHVVAWHIQWIDDPSPLIIFQKALVDWLQKHEIYPQGKSDFMPHVSVCRSPFNENTWREAFVELPVCFRSIHLYESLGYSHYRSCWQYSFKPPFEEVEHTADIAFNVFGKDIAELHRHAQIALSFKFPALLAFLSASQPQSLDEVVMDLNDIIGRADAEIGCPFKAVSFHGDLVEKEDNVLEWEMIVDV